MKIEPTFVSPLLEMYQAGSDQKEIVEALGISYFQARYWLKKKGLYDPERRQSGKAPAMRGCQEYNEERKRMAELVVESDIESHGFWYVGGYDGRDSAITIRCRKCWRTFERTYDTHFKKRLRTIGSEAITCPHCVADAKRREEEKQRYRELAKKHDQEVRRRRQELKTQKRLNEKHFCKECGCEYTLASYAQKEKVDVAHMSSTSYCSSKCRRKFESRNRRKYNQTHGKHSKRCDKYQVEFDPTVNLDTLIEKVGERCALCGGLCNKNDYKIKNGVYLFGDTYPSIDHIVPLSKGVKGHTWDNVQVAHRRCNSKKGTKVVA